METIKKYLGEHQKPSDADFFIRFWEKSLVYIKTFVDVVHEPILVLDKDLQVIAANEPFYRTFQVEPTDTEGEIVYKLGNGQWDIPALRKLLEDVLPKNTFFKGFEVAHDFPLIGRKVMILNARQIHLAEGADTFPPIILLAIEDITEMIAVAEKLTSHVKEFEAKLLERTIKLETQIGTLSKELNRLKKTP